MDNTELIKLAQDEADLHKKIDDIKETPKTDYLQDTYTDYKDALCPSLFGERCLNYAILWALNQISEASNGTKFDADASRELSVAYWSYLEAKNTLMSIVQQSKRAAGFTYFRWALERLNWDEDRNSGAEIGCFLQESKSLTHVEFMVSPKCPKDPNDPDQVAKCVEKYGKTAILVAAIRAKMKDRLSPHLKQICPTDPVRVGLIVHFLKDEGTPFSVRSDSSAEDAKTRNEQANAFLIYHAACRDRNLRALAPLVKFVGEQRSKEENERIPILAIDAANYEEYCPPEIFAQVFKAAPQRIGLHVETDNFQTLRRTFHVGEVFPHLLTGLRRIYEAIEFLGLEPGDRLGHASALGIDVRNWLSVNPRVDQTRIDILDDAVFELHLLQEHRPECHARINELQGTIGEVSREIFGEPVEGTVLIKSWLARGNVLPEWPNAENEACPGNWFSDVNNIPLWIRLQGELLRQEEYSKAENLYGEEPGTHSIVPSLFQLGSIRIAHGLPEAQLEASAENTETRQSITNLPPDQAIRILYEYLHDVRTVRKFVRTKNIDVSSQADNLERVQAILRSIVSDQGLTIESNPTSNWLIGGWESQTDVPAVQWSKNYQSMAITINPDDPSVFSTSPENEYFFVFATLMRQTNGSAALTRTEALERIRALRLTSLEASFLT